MRLWLLRPEEGLGGRPSPWEPWYDKAFGFVVRANSEAEARKLAHEGAGDENRSGKSPWLTSAYSTCVRLPSKGEAGVVMQDFASA